MADKNKRNLIYFESKTMRGLYETMENWQNKNEKRLLSANIQQDGEMFCCIALSNPSEVILCNGNGPHQASISGGDLMVYKRGERPY